MSIRKMKKTRTRRNAYATTILGARVDGLCSVRPVRRGGGGADHVRRRHECGGPGKNARTRMRTRHDVNASRDASFALANAIVIDDVQEIAIVLSTWC